MKIAIVGAGIAGLSAAYDLARGGHEVAVFEAGQVAGGLAAGFRDERWDWPLERFYHHIFQTDAAIIKLTEEIGFTRELFFRSAVTAQWWHDRPYALDGVLPVLRFPGLPFPDRVRFGAAIAYLKYVTNNWRRLEGTTAASWTRRWMGKPAYTTLIRPLLEGKFGPHADEVNMAWLWSRFKARSFKLGYFQGGFQGFVDALQRAVEAKGARVHLNTAASAAHQLEDGRWELITPGAPAITFDQLLVTGSPQLLSRLAPQLPASYLGQLKQLRSMGAVVLTLALRQQLLDTVYWLMPPKGEFPFLALVEHTNFIEAEHYGGDRLVYCGDYLEPDHEYFRLSEDELLERFLPALKRVNPAFERSWVRAHWLHREPYAQPIVPLNHSRNIPPITTPLRGLHWASMSQVYPWDRGTNFAVELGRRAAAEITTAT
ncbi:NAD(P)/FAD-dependent oxidoreductase [Oscillochloris sp. ZM17-4]|uniref:NAD(P)/FAD-dependent oxidoreductase n=1 Tax=Oscillochloris sp. ZM17-4 TaxID=2866714 RepID=UPI001C73BDD1|nr:NAD(P)/FAD-dependent oxidoreductase [Oscillochloris sp. ZM17-4]